MEKTLGWSHKIGWSIWQMLMNAKSTQWIATRIDWYCLACLEKADTCPWIEMDAWAWLPLLSSPRRLFLCWWLDDGGGGWWWQPSAPPQTLPVSPRQISCTLLNHPLADSLQFHIKTWPCYFDYYASSQIPSLLTSFGIFLSFFPFPSCMTLIFIFPSVKKNKRWRWCAVLRKVCVCVSIQLHPIQSALCVWLQNRCWQFNIHGNLQKLHSVTSNHIVLNLLRQ